MKIYLVSRTDGCGYDEYDSFVVKAETKENALSLARKEVGRWEEDTFTESNTEITEILAEGEEQVILGSFNAG